MINSVMQQLAAAPKRRFEYKLNYEGSGKPNLLPPAPPKPGAAKSSAPKWWERD